MTGQPTRDQLREAAEGHLRFGGGGDDLANGVLALLDALDQAEADRDWNLRSSRLSKEERIKANARADQAEFERDHARAQVDRVRELLTKWVDEYGDPVYRGNGWAEGVRDAAREALKAMDGER